MACLRIETGQAKYAAYLIFRINFMRYGDNLGAGQRHVITDPSQILLWIPNCVVFNSSQHIREDGVKF